MFVGAEKAVRPSPDTKTCRQPVDLQIDLVKKTKKIVGGVPDEQVATPVASFSGKRCYVCVREIAGADGYKEKKNKLNNKWKTSCLTCSKVVCPKHFLPICNDCNH